MEQTILVKHKQAYDTEENWKANNPILLAGQLAYSSDKYGKYKVGDGVTNWNDLEYCNEKVFTGTREEYETANKNGEIKPGTIVNITDDNDYQDINIDTELSEESENLVTNKTVTKGIKYNDTKDNTVTFTSNDTLEPPAYSDVSLLESNEKHSSIFNKISTMFKNIRYLSGLLGTQDISSIGEGTVTSAINTINTNLLKKETLLAKGHAKNVSTNLNLIKESGIYVIGDVGEYTNLPLEIAESGYCELVVFNSGIYIVQEIFTPFDTKGNIYYRFRTEREDGWKSWKAFGEIYDGYDETRKGFAADATQLNKEVEGSYAAWVAEEISGINADLNQRLKVPRNAQNLDDGPGINTLTVKEQGPYSENIPEENWFHAIRSQGDDTNYQVQLLLGMTSNNMYFRNMQNGGWKPWDKILKNSDLSTIIPQVFKYAIARQPIFAISTSSEDKMYISNTNDRGCKRNSSEKALIFKCTYDSGHYVGYGLISKTREGALCTPVHEYGEMNEPIKVTTPRGFNAYFSGMKYEVSYDTPVVAVVGGTISNITELSFDYYDKTNGMFFILSMVDYYIL